MDYFIGLHKVGVRADHRPFRGMSRKIENKLVALARKTLRRCTIDATTLR